jgi:hypothetical protein
MLKTDQSTVLLMMRRAVDKARQDGVVKVRPGQLIGLPHVFSFNAQDVEGIYTQKLGVGDGLWFRLKDGRVFDSRGQPSDSDPACYGESDAQGK